MTPGLGALCLGLALGFLVGCAAGILLVLMTLSRAGLFH